MNVFRATVVVLLLAPTILTAQAPQSNGKPTELVVVEFERLVANGAFLTPEGWKKAGKLYEQSKAFPPDGKILLMATGGNLGEDWVKGNEALVETKWTDDMGTIDSTLRFQPPNQYVTMTSYVFRLVYSNKHRDIGRNGETVRELTGPWEWKLAEPQTYRVATPVRAIEYLALMRDKTDSPLIKQNAGKTIAALKRTMNGCGRASAC
jgi:4-amino-4-deoxy-L-arabinose transferase-like glycosyltransferase